MTLSKLNIAALQLNLRVGDLMENMQSAAKAYHEAVAAGATFVMGPELMLTGYPPKDNLLYQPFLDATKVAEDELVAQVGEVPFAFGTLRPASPVGDYGQRSHNAYVVAQHGKIIFETTKRFLAQGGVFDEWRVHKPGTPKLFVWQGLKIGFPICEDIWHQGAEGDVVAALVKQGAEVLLVPNGSPTFVGKPALRHALVQRHVKAHGVPMLYLNHAGGQDEHVFDGGAFFCNTGAQVQTFAPYWQEGTFFTTLTKARKGWQFASEAKHVVGNDIRYMRDGLLVGTRDYILKSSSLRKVVIGISGGVDSAVVLAIAVLVMRSLGLDPATHIIAVSMPSKHNGAATKGFAEQLCKNLGIPLHWWPIEDAVDGLRAGYEAVFGEALAESGNVADENAQSRERGQILMAIANRQNAMLLSTGNKSEMAVGYATLYGDMNGGFNPLKTTYKTQVYGLGYALNESLAELGYGAEAIPHGLIRQRPSAELAANQFDDNSLPPYPVLDAILTCFLDKRMGVAEIVGSGAMVVGGSQEVNFTTHSLRHLIGKKGPMQHWTHSEAGRDDPETWTVAPSCVQAVVELVLRMRYKRYQACPGVTITAGSFDDGERFPIANATMWVMEGLAKAA